MHRLTREKALTSAKKPIKKASVSKDDFKTSVSNKDNPSVSDKTSVVSDNFLT